MSRIRGARLVAPALAALVAAGCGGGEGGGDAGDSGGGEAAAPAAHPVDAATAGSISGRIVFEGVAPEMEAIDMSAEAACADKWTETPMAQSVVVNDNGTLANVFVHVTAGPTSELSYPAPSDSQVLDQDGCRYIPHVMGIRTGQELTIRNSDGILHNINASPTENRGFNISQPVNMESTRSFPVAEVMIPLRCDVHGWMSAYLGVLDHPNFAVSGDDGSFSIDRLPPGDYTVEAWHETYGVLTANVTVESGATADVEITFSADMAENAVVPLGEPVDLHDHGTRTVADAQ